MLLRAKYCELLDTLEYYSTTKGEQATKAFVEFSSRLNLPMHAILKEAQIYPLHNLFI